MPRASRVFLPGHVWDLIHCCHRQQFLLEVVRERRRSPLEGCWGHDGHVLREPAANTGQLSDDSGL